MSISPVAEALFRATKSRLTGKLRMRSGGRESILGLHEGDLVAVEASFGFQGTAQALLNAGRIDLGALDALWARGDAGRMGEEDLEELGTPLAEAHELTVLANVRNVTTLATEARFEEAEVEPEFTPLKGARVVRAAFEAANGEAADAVYRCEDPSACEPWLLDDGEKAFVGGLTEFRKPDAPSPALWSLLRILELDGTIQRLDGEAWRREEAARLEEERARRAEEEAARRLAEEERARRAEEEARRQAEEEERLRAEEEARRQAEEDARLRAEEEARLRAEEDARRQAEEEARRLEEEERQRQEAEERARQEEAARLAEAMRQAAESLGGGDPVPQAEAAAPEVIPAPLPLITLPELTTLPTGDEAPPPVIRLTAEIDTSRPPTDPEMPAVGHPRLGVSSDTQKVKNPLAEQAPITEPRARLPVPQEPSLAALSREAEEGAMRDARAKAQQDVLRDVHEALRRASASGDEEAWLAEPPGRGAAPAPQPEILLDPANAEPPPGTLPEWALSTTEAAGLGQMMEVPAEAPLPELGAQAESPDAMIELSAAEEAAAAEADAAWTLRPPPASEAPPAAPAPAAVEGDLWRIVSFDQSPEGALTSSFEEALRQVDAHLEKIVGLPVAPAPAPVPVPVEVAPVEALADAPAAPAPMADDNAPPTEQTWDSSELDELEEFFGEDEDQVAGDPSDPAEAARLRRQRLLRRAMENLGAPMGPRPSSQTAPRQEPVPPAPPGQAPAGEGAARSPEDEKLAQQIQARFRQLQSRPDHFTVLGLGREAGREAVKNAFLNLAKLFHPDRLPPTLQELAPQMTQIFEAIRDAYEVLYDDAKRQSYLFTLQSAAPPTGRGPAAGPAPSSKAANDALELFKKGEVHFKKRDYQTAEELYDRAYALDAKGTYLAAKAWSIYMDPARKADGARAKQLMQDAVRADPLCDRAHYQLGVIARVEGDMDRAERHFREAVKANPKHLEANQELRLIEMRKKNAPGKKGGGLFGR